MPQRHSRNNNDLSHFTYEERRRLGFGTQKERLGKDSIKEFDGCCLCLKAVIDPLCCQKGHIFCKECIYACLLAQKKDIKKKVALYTAQEEGRREEAEQAAASARERELEAFDRQNNSAVPLGGPQQLHRQGSSNGSGGFHGANSVKTTAFEEEALRTMKAYWLPSATPEAAEKLDAPSTDTVCPEGNEKLRLKDLFALRFVELPRQEMREIDIRAEKYMCPSCSETLTNTTRLVALSPCGHVFCRYCADKFLATDGACTVCAKPCKKKHIVDLEKGGTGFSAHGDPLQATTFKPLGSGASAAPRRLSTRL
eukprot:jgi/Mesen1/6202/ME000320S05400